MYNLKTREIENPNKWITPTYTENETKLASMFKKITRYIKLSFKINNKLDNIINNKIEKPDI